MFVPAGCVLGTWYEPEHVRVYSSYNFRWYG